MREQTLRRIIAAAGVLLLVYFAVRLLSPAARESGGSVAKLLDSVRRGSLLGATITTPGGDSLRITSGGTPEQWRVNGFAADPATVGLMRRILDSARVVDVVSRAPENHQRLGVSPDSAVAVELRTESGSFSFLLGKVAVKLDNVYVRVPGEDIVYEVFGELHSAFALPIREWRDKTVIAVDTALVRSIVLQRDSARIVLARDAPGWKALVQRPRSADTTLAPDPRQIMGILHELSHFDAATDFLPGSTPFAGADSRRIIVLGAAGDTLVDARLAGEGYAWLLSVNGSAASRAQSPGPPEIYRVASVRVDRLIPPLRYLVPAIRG